MHFSKPILSIDTDLSSYSSVSSNITKTTQISPTWSKIDSFKISQTSESLFSESENIKITNKIICNAVKKRLAENKEAKCDLEIQKLKKEIRGLKTAVDKLKSDIKYTNQRVDFIKNENIPCPSLAKHKILVLKEKLKALKKKNKADKEKMTQDENSQGNVDLKTGFANKNPSNSPYLNSCGIF